MSELTIAHTPDGLHVTLPRGLLAYFCVHDRVDVYAEHRVFMDILRAALCDGADDYAPLTQALRDKHAVWANAGFPGMAE